MSLNSAIIEVGQFADTGFGNQKLRVDMFRKGFAIYDNLDEPTYLTFYIDFDFYNLIDNNTGFLASPLFNMNIDPKQDDVMQSAYGYFDRNKMTLLADHMREFIMCIKNISINTPWYLQSINGLDKLWSSLITSMSKGSIGDVELDIGCLESIDLRILQLAELYQKCTYDQLYLRSNLPSNLRQFNMKICIGEVRDIYTNLEAATSTVKRDSIAGSFQNAAGISNSSESLDSTFTQRLNSIYYYQFDCYQCEFDFTPVMAPKVNAFVDKNIDTSFKIKVGRVLSSASFGNKSSTSNLFRDRYSTSDERAATRKALTDDITNATRSGLQRENITLMKLAESLGPFSQVAKSSLLKAERAFNDITRTPDRFVNNALSEAQRLIENGSLGNANRQINSARRNF